MLCPTISRRTERQTRRKARRALLAMASAAVLTAGIGCGGRKGTSSGGSATATPTPTVAPTVTPTPTPTSTPPGVVDPNAFVPDSIAFVSTSANTVAILGSGGNNSTTITFEVRNQLGQPIPNQCVSFTLGAGGLGGGELLNPAEAPATGCTQITDAAGQIRTIFRGGTVPGTVSIIAFIDSNNDQLVTAGEISTSASVGVNSGPPSGRSFTLAVESPFKGAIMNGAGGIGVIGDRNNVTATMADAFTNAVPDNTVVTFKTIDPVTLREAFSIQGTGQTAGGTSQVVVPIVSLEPSITDGIVTPIGFAQGGADSSVLSLLRRPLDNALFAGTDGGGIYRSLDNGMTWTLAGEPEKGLLNGIVHDMVANPTNTAEFFAATAEGVYSSITGVNYRVSDGSQRIFNEQAVPTCAPNTFTTPCNTWNLTKGALGVARTVVEAQGAVQVDFTLSTVGNPPVTQITFPTPRQEVVASYDNRNRLRTDVEALAIVADTTDLVAPATLYVGLAGGGVYRTLDGGLNWAPINSGLNHPAVQDLAHDPDTGALYAATEAGGVYRCAAPNSATPTWVQVNGNGATGLPDLNVTAIAEDPGTQLLCAGTKTAGVLYSNDQGVTWNVPAGNGFQAIADNDVTSLRAVGGQVFVATTTDNPNPNTTRGNVWRSTTNPPNFAPVAASGVTNRFFADAIAAGAEIIAGGKGRTVVRSTDTGATFTNITGAAPTGITNNLYDGVDVFYGGPTRLSTGEVVRVSGPTTLTAGDTTLFRVLVYEGAFRRPLVPGSTITFSLEVSPGDVGIQGVGTGQYVVPVTGSAGAGVTDFIVGVRSGGVANNNSVNINVTVASQNGNLSGTVATVNATP